MRVVAGKYRGKALVAPSGEAVRPTTTRIKETLFNILQGYVAGATVLDLFAGSGALGIECISRGAEDVTFVDRSKESVACIYENLKGVKGAYRVVNADFSSALTSAYTQGRKFDIIFLDPPYKSTLAELAIETIISLNLLADDGVIVFEHSTDKDYQITDSRYIQRTKKMGTVTAEFIRKKHVALMAGSFDPITRGHEEVLAEALRGYDEVVVACLVNPDKTYLFNPAQRLALVNAVCEQHKGARGIYSEKLAVEVAIEVGAEVLIRGVRGKEDEEYEQEMARFNSEHGFETEFIVLDGFKEISSTLVKEQLEKGNLKGLPAACIAVYLSEEFKTL